MIEPRPTTAPTTLDEWKRYFEDNYRMCERCGCSVPKNATHLCATRQWVYDNPPPPAAPSVGWQCPRCSRVNAPFVSACLCNEPYARWQVPPFGSGVQYADAHIRSYN